MNDRRRRQIRKIQNQLEGIQAQIKELQEAEEWALDALPENLQFGDKGELMQDSIDQLEYSAGGIDDILENLKTATGDINF